MRDPNLLYILDEQKNPVPVKDVVTWAKWFESTPRHVACTEQMISEEELEEIRKCADSPPSSWEGFYLDRDKTKGLLNEIERLKSALIDVAHVKVTKFHETIDKMEAREKVLVEALEKILKEDPSWQRRDQIAREALKRVEEMK